MLKTIRALSARALDALQHRLRSDSPGQFQRYSHTLPNRYPWLFSFAAETLGAEQPLRLLSFGCSRGDEVFALRSYFPRARIRGIDIAPRNISICRARTKREGDAEMDFAIASSAEGETDESYDAVFCLAVLANGDLTNSRAPCCAPNLYFCDFERVTESLARSLKPGGILFLHTTNFRFSDTRLYPDFEVLLAAGPSQMASDVKYGRDNLLLEGVQYCDVVFRKTRSYLAASDCR